MIGWKDDAIRLYDVILYGMESQEGRLFCRRDDLGN